MGEGNPSIQHQAGVSSLAGRFSLFSHPELPERGDDVKITRRKFLHSAAGAAALPVMTRVAWAQAYPTRPITIVDTFPPGGSTGILARIVAERLSQTLGQQVVVDQRGGAGGTLGARQVARSAPDGYTLMLGFTSNLATGP